MIRCEGLTRVYGAPPGQGAAGSAFTALAGLDLEIGAGEFVAVMGPSGCGKSTLLAILGLMDRPSSGRYLLDGQEASALGERERTLLRRMKIGFVFQAFNLLPRLSALENVELPMAYAGVRDEDRRARAAGLLARVGLGSKTGSTPLELSGGERQRVGIARALGNDPSVILADEPTGNLDSRASREILALVRELHGEGKTIVLVTHDPAIAAAAGRTVRLKDGRLEP